MAEQAILPVGQLAGIVIRTGSGFELVRLTAAALQQVALAARNVDGEVLGNPPFGYYDRLTSYTSWTGDGAVEEQYVENTDTGVLWVVTGAELVNISAACTIAEYRHTTAAGVVLARLKKQAATALNVSFDFAGTLVLKPTERLYGRFEGTAAGNVMTFSFWGYKMRHVAAGQGV